MTAGWASLVSIATRSRRPSERARHSGRENFSIASISIDNHRVCPCSVRHDGSCWLIAAPSSQPFKKLATTNSRAVSFVPKRKLPKETRTCVIRFTIEFDALP